jgi:hypothetical protein
VQSVCKEELSLEELAEFRDASLPGYELRSREIELSWQNNGRKELGGAKKTSCVI